MSATQSTTEVVTTTINGTTLKRPKYPIGVPEKVNLDGVFQRYPGNTTLCHLPADSPLQPGLKALHNALKSHPVLSKKMSLLPPSSWHMTVFDGVREKECEPGMWPAGKEKQTVEESTRDFAALLRQYGPELEREGLAPPYHMRVRNYDAAVVGVGLEIVGVTDEEQARMRRLRDRLGDILGFKAPNHWVYEFHLSMAYLLSHVDGEDRKALNAVFAEHEKQIKVEFDLGAVEFCTFEDMRSFPRQFYLGETEN